MKLTISKTNLETAVTAAARATNARSALPILDHVGLSAYEDGGRLTVAGTNLEMRIERTFTRVDVEEGGAIAVPARTLVDLVKMLPDGPVALETDDKRVALAVKTDATEATIKGQPYEEFPALTVPKDDTAGITFDAGDLTDMVGRVAHAAATDESRLILTGVLLKLEPEGLTLAATDGFRLAVLEVGRSVLRSDYTAAILPARALVEMARAFKDASGKVLMVLDDRRVMFEAMNGTRFVTMLIEGNFPDYRQIIPSSYSTRLTLSRPDLEQAVKRARVFARDSADIVKLTVSIVEHGPALLTVAATSAETGDGTTDLEVSADGDEIEIAFAGRYLIDALAAIGTETVALELTTASSPGMLRPVGEQGDKFLVVVMPMHLGR